MMDYKKAGVDIEAGYKSVELMKEHVKKTMRSEVLGGLGGFLRIFTGKDQRDGRTALLSGTDGCGTKVKLAIIMDATMSLVLTQWLCVLMILPVQAVSHYSSRTILPAGKNYPEKIADIVKGGRRLFKV